MEQEMQNSTPKIANSNLTALQKIFARIEKAAIESNRSLSDITLVVVSKTFGIQEILPLLQAGHRIFGENRVQEAHTKWSALRINFPDVELHLIGPLQSKKAAEAVRLFDVIETIDREKIAAILAHEAYKQSKRLRFYVQVNTGFEPQKAGIAPQDAIAFIRRCQTNYHLDIKGLMCIPPVEGNPGSHFALLEKIGREAGLEHFSMGMSGDFETAIAFGSTSIRIGSAIFGHRKQPESEIS